MGVFASAVLLYGMSFSTVVGLDPPQRDRRRDRQEELAGRHPRRVRDHRLAFKVSAVPFHSWAPDTYEAHRPGHALWPSLEGSWFVAIIQVVANAFSTPTGDLWKVTTPSSCSPPFR